MKYLVEAHIDMPMAEKSVMDDLKAREIGADSKKLKPKDVKKLTALKRVKRQHLVDENTQQFTEDGVDYRRVIVPFVPDLTGEENAAARDRKIGRQADKLFDEIAENFPGIRKHALHKWDGLQVGILPHGLKMVPFGREKSKKTKGGKDIFIVVDVPGGHKRVRSWKGAPHWPKPAIDLAKKTETRERSELDSEGLETGSTETYEHEYDVPVSFETPENIVRIDHE